MSTPLVTIVMPCYQNGQTLEKTVRSVQNQRYPYWELIAVNDGSTDDTLKRLRALEALEPRMRVIDQPNGGVSSARNAGIEAANGEWLFFLDADDWITPDALQTLVGLANEQLDIVCGAYVMRFIDEENREEEHVCADGDLQTVLESLIRGDSALNSMCARLYRTEMIRKNRIAAPMGMKVGEDVIFNLYAFSAARAWKIVHDIVYVYEFGGDSAMTRARNDRYARSLPMIEAIGRFLDENQLRTQLFRAHIDLYLRTLRVDRGRVRAALAFNYRLAGRITAGVQFSALCAKQKLYYLVLRILPWLSYFLP